MRIENNTALAGWDGYHADSYFSGVLVKYIPEDSAVIAGTFFC